MSDRRFPWRLLAAVSLLVLLAGLSRRSRSEPELSPAPDRAASPPAAQGTNTPAALPLSEEADLGSTVPSSMSHSRSAVAYRFQLHGDRCELLAADPIQGGFRQRPLSRRQPGMLRCRLLDAEERVLAEEFLPQPDFHCVVLDPVQTSGKAVPAQLTDSGPVVVQTRLPSNAEATILEIGRLKEPSDETPDSPRVHILAQFALPTQR